MEAEVVVVTDIEEVISPESGRLFYVALTRAKHRLIILPANEDVEWQFKEWLATKLR